MTFLRPRCGKYGDLPAAKAKSPTEAQLEEARSLVGGQWIELDSARQTIRFLRPGMKINLGSIGKGYALDVCAARFSSWG